MSRSTGQVRGWQALGYVVAATAVLAAIVAASDALLLPGKPLPELPAPAEPATEPAAAPDPGCPPADALITEQVTSAQLYECPASYDGRVIRFEGEVVGAVLRRGARAWVQLNDDPYGLLSGPLPEHRTNLGGNSGLAVLVPTAAIAQELIAGGHDRQGAVLAVRGRFRVAHPLDAGGPAMLADTARVLRPARALQPSVWAPRQWAALAAALLTLGLLAAALRARRRRFG